VVERGHAVTAGRTRRGRARRRQSRQREEEHRYGETTRERLSDPKRSHGEILRKVDASSTPARSRANLC
jgi:hypothetical protein